MTMSELALRMIPFWFFGLFMVYSTIYSGNKDLLRFESKPFAKWLVFIFFLSLYRMCIFHFFSDHELIRAQTQAVTQIPWQAAFTVFWEDMSFVVPLVLLSRMLPKKRWAEAVKVIALIFMMVSFGSGHIYQGWFSALLLSFYVPVSLGRGQKVGFGTIILCHMAYYLSTMLAIRWAIGN